MSGNRRRATGERRGGLPLAVGLAILVLLGVGLGAVAVRSGGGSPAEESAGLGEGEPRSAAVLPVETDGSGEDGEAGEAARPTDTAATDGARAPGAAARPDPAVDWAAPTDPSPVEPVPAEQRVRTPEAVRGIYVGAWTVGNADRLARLIRLADETEVNAFVIDVKDVTGEISYASQLPLAKQVGATRQTKIGDIRGVLERLREHGIYPIARIVVFKDPLLATERPEWSIQHTEGGIWEDDNGVHWVDSYNPHVWDYNIELAREAIALGFSEIQWDYVRFPDVPNRFLKTAVFPARDGRTRVEGVRAFMTHARDRLADLEVPVTADVFGVTTSARHDVGIGQVWEEMADVVDVLLPMVYPSHYPRGTWSYENPNAAPYQIVRKAMDHATSRSVLIDGAAGIRPWLQAFSMGEPEYGPRHIRAQIDAVYDAGLTEWILWHPGVRYPREAFATADGIDPWFAGMGRTLYEDHEGPGVDAAYPDPEVEPTSSVNRGGPLGQPVSSGGGG